MSDLFGNHIVGFPTRRLISLFEQHHEKKTEFGLCENKGTDRLCSFCTADQCLCFCYTDSIIIIIIIMTLFKEEAQLD